MRQLDKTRAALLALPAPRHPARHGGSGAAHPLTGAVPAKAASGSPLPPRHEGGHLPAGGAWKTVRVSPDRRSRASTVSRAEEPPPDEEIALTGPRQVRARAGRGGTADPPPFPGKRSRPPGRLRPSPPPSIGQVEGPVQAVRCRHDPLPGKVTAVRRPGQVADLHQPDIVSRRGEGE